MFFNSESFTEAFVLDRNFSMQTGVRTATTAACDRFSAIASALPPATQPPHMQPTNASAAAPPTAPHRAGLSWEWMSMGARLSLTIRMLSQAYAAEVRLNRFGKYSFVHAA